MDGALANLIRQLDLEPLEVNLFRGQSSDLGGKSVFGGQVIGQALVAATRTVEARAPHSLHAYFLLPGDMAAPIVYEVDRIRDGRSFTAPRGQAIQHGQAILSMIASFHIAEPGPEHQAPMPQVPPPESLRPISELRDQWFAEAGEAVPDRVRDALLRPSPIDSRPVVPWNPLKPTRAEPRQEIWFRAVDRMPDDPLLHTCMLTYACDYHLMATAVRPPG